MTKRIRSLIRDKVSERAVDPFSRSRGRSNGHIYFIQGKLTRLIKIGHSLTPSIRLKELQANSPDILELIATVPGKRSDELHIHQQLINHRLHAEWFAPTEEVLERIKNFQDSSFFA